MAGESNKTEATTPKPKDKVLVAIGKQIRTMREASGISQEDFAAIAGIDRSYYGAIERGERNVAALNLVRIASALEVEVGTLFVPLQELHALTQTNPSES